MTFWVLGLQVGTTVPSPNRDHVHTLNIFFKLLVTNQCDGLYWLSTWQDLESLRDICARGHVCKGWSRFYWVRRDHPPWCRQHHLTSHGLRSWSACIRRQAGHQHSFLHPAYGLSITRCADFSAVMHCALKLPNQTNSSLNCFGWVFFHINEVVALFHCV